MKSHRARGPKSVGPLRSEQCPSPLQGDWWSSTPLYGPLNGGETGPGGGVGEQRRPLPTGDWSCGLLAGIPIFFLYWNNVSRWKRCRNSTKNCQTVFAKIAQMFIFYYIHVIIFLSLHTLWFSPESFAGTVQAPRSVCNSRVLFPLYQNKHRIITKTSVQD